MKSVMPGEGKGNVRILPLSRSFYGSFGQDRNLHNISMGAGSLCPRIQS